MTVSVDPLPPLAPERRLSGTTRVVLAFVTGTLFALLPIYYFYTGRAVPGTGASPDPTLTAAPQAPRAASATEPAGRFAARMTYELSHTPPEPAPVRVTAAPPIPSERVTAAVPAPAADPAASRVYNARPITAAPPDPRDTTRAMEKEARRTEVREPASRQIAQGSVQGNADVVQPRVVEGRDIVLPPKPGAVPTRAIGAAPRVEPARVATANVVSGASPNPPAPEAKAETQQKHAAGDRPADMLGSRLAATREWLGSAAHTTHTIQLMGANSEEQLKAHLKSLGKLLEPAKIYVFRTIAQGKPSMTIVYGAYPDRKAALDALEKLPAPIVANRPVLRTVNGIRNEQKQHGIDS